MPDLQVNDQQLEQEICINCGFCCDGTLFNNANVKNGEKGTLPRKIELNYFKKGDKEYFKLPCLYFSKKCTIYNQKKASICSDFRCQLLVDFAAGIVSQEAAIGIVNRARGIRKQIFADYRKILGFRSVTTFRNLLGELGEIQKSEPEKTSLSIDVEILNAKCNIFESLLIKHFKSEKNFQEMISEEKDIKENLDI